MFTDEVECTIERRLLINYRIDPEVVSRQLPAPFRPQLVGGSAVGGVCFIRLGNLRPAGTPAVLGLRTENVVHRFAVEWDDDEGTQVGVYIPRRDTDSRITSWAGDRLFPGRHHLARFVIDESRPNLRLGVSSQDGEIGLSVSAREVPVLESNLFASAEDALDFFRMACVGYSPSGPFGRLVGVGLEGTSWQGQAMSVDHMVSSVFDNTNDFPSGSCVLDSGLVMRNLDARWVTKDVLSASVDTLAA